MALMEWEFTEGPDDDGTFVATGKVIDFAGFLRAYVEGSDEVRRQVNGVWQHKHEGYDYWHPMARVHKEAKE